MPRKNGRGFAGMDPDEQREIASRGGRAAHQSGNAHEFNSEEATDAGRKGGLAAHHRNAAFYHEAGEGEEAARHSALAHGHGETARGHSQRSRRGFAAMDAAEPRRIPRAARRGRTRIRPPGSPPAVARGRPPVAPPQPGG